MRQFGKRLATVVVRSTIFAVAFVFLTSLPACHKSAQQAAADPPLTDYDAQVSKPPGAIDQAAAALEKGLKLRNEQAIASADDTPQTPQVDYAALAAAGLSMPSAPQQGPVISEAPSDAVSPTVHTPAPSEPGELVGPPSPTPQSSSLTRAELSARLVEVVRQAIHEDADPLQAALPLIGLGLVEPGVSEPEMRALLEPLSPPEKATVLAVRELLTKIASGELSSTDPKALADALASQRKSLLESAGVADGGFAAGTVALCTRVESFGQFTPRTSNRLLSGQSTPALAYTEVRGFTQRPTTHADSSASLSEDGFLVELSQEIALYTDSPRPVLQWRIPAQTVRSFSRSKRGDFYLVQRLDFPRTLAAGAYQLRITVRDLNAAKSETGQAAATFETALSLEVVADAALLKVPSAATVVGSMAGE